MSTTPTDPLFEPCRPHRIYEPPAGPDDLDDEWGTSHLFDELVSCAFMIGWNFDEQIAAAPPELLEKLIVQVLELDAYLADVRCELGLTK